VWVVFRIKAVVAIGALALSGVVVPAAAEPATTIVYPGGSVATRYVGYAFDTCTAPTVAQMTAWKASPYKAIGIYIGGVNRSCAQPQLTASWVSTVTRMGWRLIPIYLGLQAPCTNRTTAQKISPSAPGTQGTAAATDAFNKARALGLLAGSAIYDDMEHYDVNNTSCSPVVLSFLSAWTKELHRRGFLSGVYVHQDSGARHLAQAYYWTSYARPDAIWIARWDLNSSLINWPTVSNLYWTVGQRAKQYRGDHNETYGGVTLNIDSDRFDAPVGAVGFAYQTTTTVSARSGPTTAYPVVTTYASGATVQVSCQTYGTKVGTTTVWNKLINGTYVTDYYVNTPSNTTYTSLIPGCSLPFQTTTSLTKRSGPSTSYAAVGTLGSGALAWITCQAPGSKVGTTSVWNRLTDGSYVTDYYVATASNTTYTAPLRRC
jgi:uncharacterized protein YraI